MRLTGGERVVLEMKFIYGSWKAYYKEINRLSKIHKSEEYKDGWLGTAKKLQEIERKKHIRFVKKKNDGFCEFHYIPTKKEAGK